ncbi:MAG: hypothetical protein O2814_00135 [Bacteroidetes bacterium]|nr:hypothetical protein [Bacteroidota bacterium]MDA1225031.1 hypothetical protein [Bacteroidota bacterium]
MSFFCSTVKAQTTSTDQSVNPSENQTEVAPNDQNFLTVAYGFGRGNLIYAVLKSLESAIPTDPNAELINVNVSKSPISFFKVEYRFNRKHSLGLNVAHNAFSINGDVRDSFFYNDMGSIVQTSVGVKYSSTSCNIRYNYFFNPDDKLQCYIGVSMGIRGNNISVNSNNPFFGKNINGLGLTLASVPSIGGDFTFGIRGDIYKSLMLFGEVGAAKAIIQGGLAYRL